MSSSARALPIQRFGSASELAAYSGLSLRTVRRRVADGSLRAVRLGHRVLIPFDAIDPLPLRMADHRPEAEEEPTMSIAPSPETVDTATGRLRPLTDEQRRARTEALGRALDEIAGMTDETDTDEVWDQFERGIDEDRLSDRKRFR